MNPCLFDQGFSPSSLSLDRITLELEHWHMTMGTEFIQSLAFSSGHAGFPASWNWIYGQLSSTMWVLGI